MDDLSGLLRGRYEDEERIARAALADLSAPVVTWAPERILVDLALRQRILALHRRSPVGGEGTCETCVKETWPCLTVRLLALPYADHPDYQVTWRP